MVILGMVSTGLGSVLGADVTLQIVHPLIGSTADCAADASHLGMDRLMSTQGVSAGKCLVTDKTFVKAWYLLWLLPLLGSHIEWFLK